MDAKDRDRKIKTVLLEVQQELLTPSEGLKAIREISQEYAKQKWYEACEKQRQFCAQSCYGEITDEQWDSIENAPQPEYK